MIGRSLAARVAARVARAREARSDVQVELRRLAQLPRRTPCTTTLMGSPFALVDAPTFVPQYRQFFQSPAYATRFDRPAPRIIDCGANVGVSVFFWKSLAADAAITAYEADPEIARVLESNVRAARFDDVEVVAAAAWTENGQVAFESEGADSGRVGNGAPVPAIRLRDRLSGPVDLLKLDIEGAETAVLSDCGDALRNVRRIVLEYHSFAGEEQRLADLVGVLEAAEFRLIVDTEFAPPSPLLALAPSGQATDNRLIVYGIRTANAR